LPGLVALQDGLLRLSAEAASARASSISEVSAKAANLVERLVMREIDDANAAIATLVKALEFAQATQAALEEGAPPNTVHSPFETPRADTGDRPVQFERPADEAMVLEFLEEAGEHLDAAEAAALNLERDPRNEEEINALFRGFHTIKGVAAFLKLAPIVELSHASESLLDRARDGRLELDGARLNVVLSSCDLLRRLVGQLRGDTTVAQQELNQLLQRLLRASHSGDAPSMVGTPEGAPLSGVSVASARADLTVKVTAARLDHLLDLMGELVIAQLMVAQDPVIASTRDQRVQRNVSQLARIVRELHGMALGLRMVTLKSTFQRMARVVRDLSTRAGKRIDLVVEGEETELDRAIVDDLADPLVHMVRNACDHGIELPEERVASGKPPNGTLTLRAFHRGGRVSVEISDDGRGLQRDKIVRRVVERGILSPDRRPQDVSDSEAFGFIFMPGFSTADSVTDVSGRGVGMDVVKRNIEALHGTVAIRSEAGRGTTFLIELPLTMAIIDGMVVRVGAQRYVLPTLAIECPFRPERDQIRTVLGRRELAMVRGEALPVHRLANALGVPAEERDLCDGLLVIVQSGTARSCLAIDEIIGQQQIVLKSLGDERWRSRGVAGGAILGDGRVALVLDVNGLVQEATLAT